MKEKTPFAVGFIGCSGAGKTTLASAVLARLAAAGLKVAAVKDAHHNIDLDRPGKDTWRYREAGASEVILRTAERYAVLVETLEPPGIDTLLERVSPGTDLVLIEGFKHEGSYPKILVEPGPELSEKGGALLAEDGNVCALALDCAHPDFAPGVPVLDRSNPDAVARFVLGLFEAAAAASKNASDTD